MKIVVSSFFVLNFAANVEAFSITTDRIFYAKLRNLSFDRQNNKHSISYKLAIKASKSLAPPFTPHSFS